MVASVVVRPAAAVVREELEPMPVVVRLEQVDQEFPSRFLATMEEIRNHMVQVEMAEQI
jgi:hypothetical protein